jgi:hypothetical protein
MVPSATKVYFDIFSEGGGGGDVWVGRRGPTHSIDVLQKSATFSCIFFLGRSIDTQRTVHVSELHAGMLEQQLALFVDGDILQLSQLSAIMPDLKAKVGDENAQPV